MRDVTLVVTSCARHDLLKRTLDSFVKFNTYSIAKTIVIEDSLTEAPSWFLQLEGLGQKTWIANKRQRGQIYSIDRAYSEVTTPYIFHCEDDWEFTRSGFIEASKEILTAHKEVWTVNLRADDCNGHPVSGSIFGLTLSPNWSGGWGGMSFNPGLRRLSDYRKLGSYGRHLGYGTHGFEAELALSKSHLENGFRIGSLYDKYVEHIGEGRSRAADKSFKPWVPKILIAIPACHKYTYGNQADGRNHKDQATNSRVEAVRKTWAKYLKPFESYVTLRFFYGRGTDRLPQPDEVFLDVPDDYINLPKKVQDIFKYAVEKNFDYVFKGDDDTFIYIDRLMASDFQDHDYLGYCTDDPAAQDVSRYASGGSGYWLSRAAFTLIASTVEPTDWAEDRWVGTVLRKHGIKVQRDARYLPGFWEHFVNVDALPENHSYITMHACTPDMMDKLFAKTLTPNFRSILKAIHEPEWSTVSHSTAPARQGPSPISPHSGFEIVKAKAKYATDTLTTDWWDTHIRSEKT